ncbi:SGNH/GDSL hydrolase family protein [Mycobacterium servetii]|uniref:SGNH/GDSL hydrolase family protein n=1 Tax=Mycobacterium servetii TaxID=3237418 RepID=A0ABV4C0K4_9MYCO
MSVLEKLRGLPRAVGLGAVAVLALIVGVVAYTELHDTDRPQRQAGPRYQPPLLSTMFDYKPTLLVVSDSYAGNYPDMVADKLGWSLAVDAQDGTGFVKGANKDSPDGKPFIDRLGSDAATYKVDYVLIDGGRRDLGESPDAVVAAVDRYINKVHAEWPGAKIIVVLPTSAAAEPSPNYPVVAQAIQHAAESVGAYVIDPVAQGWYRDVDAKTLLWRDGAHLNYAGDLYYANKLIANLQQMFGRKPTCLVVGDSFGVGTGDPQVVTYPHLLADKIGCNLALDAEIGTGFLHSIDNLPIPTAPFIDRLARDEATYRYHVDYVLIDGGRDDLGSMPEPVVAAADEYIKRVRSDWPKAKIIIILPSYVTTQAASNFPAVAEGLRRAADSVGAHVIDPVAQGWYRGVDLKALLAPDGIHFNAEGNKYYADKIMENLSKMGLA